MERAWPAAVGPTDNPVHLHFLLVWFGRKQLFRVQSVEPAVTVLPEVTVLDMRGYQGVDVFFCLLKLPHVWKWGWEDACEWGSVNSQHGTGVEGSLHPAQRATTARFFFYNFMIIHILFINLSIVNMLLCYSYFLLCRLKICKPCDRVTKHVFSLGPFRVVANSYFVMLHSIFWGVGTYQLSNDRTSWVRRVLLIRLAGRRFRKCSDRGRSASPFCNVHCTVSLHGGSVVARLTVVLQSRVWIRHLPSPQLTANCLVGCHLGWP
jgi:hypothetical protein